jgi:hypothetical protein
LWRLIGGVLSSFGLGCCDSNSFSEYNNGVEVDELLNGNCNSKIVFLFLFSLCIADDGEGVERIATKFPKLFQLFLGVVISWE